MNSDSDTYSSDENELEKLQSKMELAKVKRGMFVSGWEDPADDSFEDTDNPRGNFNYLYKYHLITQNYRNCRERTTLGSE